VSVEGVAIAVTSDNVGPVVPVVVPVVVSSLSPMSSFFLAQERKMNRIKKFINRKIFI
jgi:hypothetical protein